MIGRDNDFVCPACGRPCGDPLYRGPAPHAPARLCMDCWAQQWHEMEMRMLFGGAWDVVDEALWLISFGLTSSAAAGLIARHRRGLRRWLTRMRKYAHLIPDWLAADPPPATDQDGTTHSPASTPPATEARPC